MTQPTDIRNNLGSRRIPKLRASAFPDAGAAVQAIEHPTHGVDILLVNPPTPDGAIWIRSQHRVGRRSRENMVWPQVSLAQMAAILLPDYSVEVIDANALRMGWAEFERLLEEKKPKYYLTQVTAPTLRNDMYGVFVAKSLGAKTMAFGTHVTPMTLETLSAFPALDYILRGEPEMTLRELLDKFEERSPSDAKIAKMLQETSQLQSHGSGIKLYVDSFPQMDDSRPEAQHPGPGLAQGRRDRRQPGPPLYPRSGRSAHPPPRPAALGQAAHAHDQGAFHLHRYQPRLSGWLQVLHQACHLPELRPRALGREYRG